MCVFASCTCRGAVGWLCRGREHCDAAVMVATGYRQHCGRASIHAGLSPLFRDMSTTTTTRMMLVRHACACSRTVRALSAQSHIHCLSVPLGGGGGDGGLRQRRCHKTEAEVKINCIARLINLYILCGRAMLALRNSKRGRLLRARARFGFVSGDMAHACTRHGSE